MLTKEDIKSIAEGGEGYNAEFKARVPNKLKELTEEVCAFANASGGVLLLGVDDANCIQGVAIDNAKRSAIQNSLNEINPHLPCGFYKVSIGTKDVWVIEVNSGAQKPYTLSGAIYVRQGPNTQKLTTVEQMRDFFQQSGKIYFDEAPCSGFDPEEDFDRVYFEEFRIEAGLSKAADQSQIVKNLKLVLEDGRFKNGAVLFFGKQPEKAIETALVRCIAFDGLTKAQIIDDKFYGGPLIKQYEQAMQWLKNKLDVRYEIEGAGPRKERWQIPQTALKEAVINALSHRDYYDKGARIHIELFSDRVEISNPGGLASAITPSDFGIKSHSRNPLLFGLFLRVKMVEQIGSGIARMRQDLTQAGLEAPVFKTDGMFTVIFKKGKQPVDKTVAETPTTVVETVAETVVETDEAVLVAIIRGISQNPKITVKTLAAQIGLSKRGLEYHLDKLKKAGRLSRAGPNKGGHWRLND